MNSDDLPLLKWNDQNNTISRLNPASSLLPAARRTLIIIDIDCFCFFLSTGFSIKAVPLEDAVLNCKELGGKWWKCPLPYTCTRAVLGFGGSRVWRFSSLAIPDFSRLADAKIDLFSGFVFFWVEQISRVRILRSDR